MNRSAEIYNRLLNQILDGKKIPHSTSQPVLHKEEEKYYLAVFVFVMTNGMVARIIAFRSHTDMDVEFEDGVIREHVSSESFNKGKIRHPLCGMDARSVRHRKERLGESKICKDGRIATIIKYTKYDDIIVKFDDETEWNTSYQRFKLA